MQPPRQSIVHSSTPCRILRARAGFTITELLVVIGIIVVLVGILLPALAAVRENALMTSTEGTMREFSKAADIYQGDHNSYPGVLPDDVLLALPAMEKITSTENALLAMMGGYRVITPFTIAGSKEDLEYTNYSGTQIVNNVNGWSLKVDLTQIGQGPLVNLKSYTPYFSPKGSEVRRAKGQVDEPAIQLPDLIDRWGQPILYFRSSRNTGPLAFDSSNTTVLPQFQTDVNAAYLDSTALGDMGEDQTAYSLFNVAPDPDATFAQIIRTPSQGAADQPLYSTARGKYALMSAGPDGIFFSQFDGPGTEGSPVNNIVSGQYGRPEVVKEYDDSVILGGG